MEHVTSYPTQQKQLIGWTLSLFSVVIFLNLTNHLFRGDPLIDLLWYIVPPLILFVAFIITLKRGSSIVGGIMSTTSQFYIMFGWNGGYWLVDNLNTTQLIVGLSMFALGIFSIIRKVWILRKETNYFKEKKRQVEIIVIGIVISIPSILWFWGSFVETH